MSNNNFWFGSPGYHSKGYQTNLQNIGSKVLTVYRHTDHGDQGISCIQIGDEKYGNTGRSFDGSFTLADTGIFQLKSIHSLERQIRQFTLVNNQQEMNFGVDESSGSNLSYSLIFDEPISVELTGIRSNQDERATDRSGSQRGGNNFISSLAFNLVDPSAQSQIGKNFFVGSKGNNTTFSSVNLAGKTVTFFANDHYMSGITVDDTLYGKRGRALGTIKFSSSGTIRLNSLPLVSADDYACVQGISFSSEGVNILNWSASRDSDYSGDHNYMFNFNAGTTIPVQISGIQSDSDSIRGIQFRIVAP